MFNWLKRSSHSEKAVFSTEVKFNDLGKQYFKNDLSLTQNYTIKGASENLERRISGHEIASNINSIITNELKSRFERGLGFPVESIQVIEIYEGSITVLFTVVFTALQVISSLKDLYEIFELMKN